MGAGTLEIFWISASISIKRFPTNCSMESLIEERLNLAMDKGGAVLSREAN